MVDDIRRSVFRGVGAVLTTAFLAGCSSDDTTLDDSTASRSEDGNGGDEPERSYNLDLSLSPDSIDLTGVYDRLLDHFSPGELADFTEDEWRMPCFDAE